MRLFSSPTTLFTLPHRLHAPDASTAMTGVQGLVYPGWDGTGGTRIRYSTTSPAMLQSGTSISINLRLSPARGPEAALRLIN